MGAGACALAPARAGTCAGARGVRSGGAGEGESLTGIFQIAHDQCQVFVFSGALMTSREDPADPRRRRARVPARPQSYACRVMF